MKGKEKRTLRKIDRHGESGEKSRCSVVLHKGFAIGKETEEYNTWNASRGRDQKENNFYGGTTLEFAKEEAFARGLLQYRTGPNTATAGWGGGGGGGVWGGGGTINSPTFRRLDGFVTELSRRRGGGHFVGGRSSKHEQGAFEKGLRGGAEPV